MNEKAQEVSGEALDFLSGGGEMGRHLRSHDWSLTPLGRPETWPASLKTAVRLLLAAPSPLAIGWGPDLLTIHNDAFSRILLCARGPHRAGLPLRDLSPEVWQRVGPLVEAAMLRNESALLENQLFCTYRNGYAEETYLSFSCNPMSDHAANARGVMIMVTEATEQVIGARRTAALREVSAAGATARSAEDACRDALGAVARHSTDIPFALLYVARDPNEGAVRLIATAGLAAGTAASPLVIALDAAADAPTWPVRTAFGTNSTIIADDLSTRFEPLPAGDWPLAPRCAVVVPLTTRGRDQPDAVLIAGVSARHEVDRSYLDFIDLIAKHVTAAMAGGRLREEEERDAVARAAAKLADMKRRARMRALRARFAGVLEERTRLAREIHDTLLQGVTGIALQLRGALPHVQTASDEALATLERIADLAEKTSREARQVVWDIRPNVLNEHEFVRAVESAAHRTLVGASVALHIEARGRARRLDSDSQAAVLRIVQEAVANVVRHAAATTIRLTLSFDATYLRAVVADDGRGFPVEPDFRSYTGHWGLVGMQERAEQIGASLRVRSAPNEGTTVTLELPLPTSDGDTSARRVGDRARRDRAVVPVGAPIPVSAQALAG